MNVFATLLRQIVVILKSQLDRADEIGTLWVSHEDDIESDRERRLCPIQPDESGIDPTGLFKRHHPDRFESRIGSTDYPLGCVDEKRRGSATD